MTKRSRRNHGAAFKAKVAFAAIRGEKTLTELAQQLTCIPTRSVSGRISCLKGCRCLWGESRGGPAFDRREDAACQDRRIDFGERFFRFCARQGGIAQRKTMIDRGHALSLTRQAKAVGISRYGKPEIFNTDQGSQFTSSDLTGLLLGNEIMISMDGKEAWRDNVFAERLWRSVKYEEVYLRAHDSVEQARRSIGRYLSFYNGRRPHSSLDRRTPDQAYFNLPTPIPAAA